MRFLAAPWLRLLTDGVWLNNANHANTMARGLADRLRRDARLDVVFPVEANAVFVRLSDSLTRSLHSRGWRFYKFIEPDVYRLMCSWATTAADIEQLVTDLLR